MTAHLRRLICAFVGRTWHKQVFSWRGSYTHFVDICFLSDNKSLILLWHQRQLLKLLLIKSLKCKDDMCRFMKKGYFSLRQTAKARVIEPTHLHRLAPEPSLFVYKIYEPGHEKTCLMSYANNKGADQSVHLCSMISAFIVHCLDSVMCLVSISEISSLMLALVAEQVSLSLNWSESPEDTFFSWQGSYYCTRKLQQKSQRSGPAVHGWRISNCTKLKGPFSKRRLIFEPRHEKTCLRGCDQVKHKPVCTATEAR